MLKGDSKGWSVGVRRCGWQGAQGRAQGGRGVQQRAFGWRALLRTESGEQGLGEGKGGPTHLSAIVVGSGSGWNVLVQEARPSIFVGGRRCAKERQTLTPTL